MSAGPRNETGAMTELVDEKVRKEDILSNRDKAQRLPGQSLDSKGVRVDEYQDMPSNQRPAREDARETVETSTGSDAQSDAADGKDRSSGPDDVDRPGFDLGGSSGETEAGKGLGLGDDAKEGRKDWGVPR